jgi:hypothetical protein
MKKPPRLRRWSKEGARDDKFVFGEECVKDAVGGDPIGPVVRDQTELATLNRAKVMVKAT